MQELRLVAVSEDGSYAVLVVPGRSGRFALPIDERLRTVARGQFSRLAQYEIEVESPLRPKEIQDRIRAGETAEEIADAAGLPVDRIRRFEGPPLAERARWAREAQQATVRSRSEAGPGPRLGDIVAERLAGAGASRDDLEWDSRKRPDGDWQVQLAYTIAGRLHMAEWVYDVRSKHVTPDDNEAIRLCLDEAQWPEPRPAPRATPTATVTPIGSRSSSVAHQADQRADMERASRAMHPSRQPPAAVAPPYHQPAAAMPTPRVSADVPAGLPGRPAPQDQGTPPRRPASAAGASASATGAEPASARTQAASGEPVPVPAGVDAAAGAAGSEAADGRPEQAGREAGPAARPARRSAGGRSRRSSVPSWDEIMFGTSRQPD